MTSCKILCFEAGLILLLVAGCYDPMELGENFEVRIESMVDGKLTSFGFNTEGTLTLETFPPDGTKLSGAKIKGSFQLVTKDADGKSLTGTGTCEFLG